MSDTSALEAEVQLLRLELAALTARVLRLEAEKEADQGSQNIHSPRITVSYHSPCVGSPIAELPPFPGSSGQQLSSAAAAAAVAPVDLAGDSIVESVGQERLTIAREAGQFLRRCLDGVIRGTSGQDRIQAPSRCYILAKDISGKTYNSVKVFSNFSKLRGLVKSGSSCGDSVFIGWPTEEEGRELGSLRQTATLARLLLLLPGWTTVWWWLSQLILGAGQQQRECCLGKSYQTPAGVGGVFRQGGCRARGCRLFGTKEDLGCNSCGAI